jgi:hypothetical protein
MVNLLKSVNAQAPRLALATGVTRVYLQIIGNKANYGCLQRDAGTELSVFVSPMRFGSGSR